MPYSYTTTDTFTMTNAKRLAAKVAADMHQANLTYGGRPSVADIENYQQELAILLHGGYLESYEFGFKTPDDKRIVSWLYTVGPSGDLVESDRSGGLYTSAPVTGSDLLFNYLIPNDKWNSLSAEEQEAINGLHPINRTTGEPPTDGSGFWETSKQYNSGGVAVTRKAFRPYDN